MFEIIYNYIFVFFVMFFLTKKLNTKFFGISKNIYALFFLLHLLITFVYIIVFPIGDWETYLMPENRTILDYRIASFFSSHLIFNIITFLKKILFFNNANIILVFSLISFFGIIIFVKNLIKLGIKKKVAYMFFFIPGIHFWTCVPGKDSLILFLLSCFFSFYIDRKILISVIFLITLTLLRPHIGAIFLFSLFLTEFIFIKGIKNKFLCIITSLIFFGVLFNLPIIKSYFFNTQNLLSDNPLIHILNQFHAIIMKYRFTDSFYMTSSNMFENIFNYIIFPLDLIFKNNSILINIAIFVEILTIIFITNLFLQNHKKIILDKKLIIFLSVSVSIYLLIIPQSLFNFGLNMRQKWMIIPFVIYLIFLLRNLPARINKK